MRKNESALPDSCNHDGRGLGELVTSGAGICLLPQAVSNRHNDWRKALKVETTPVSPILTCARVKISGLAAKNDSNQESGAILSNKTRAFLMSWQLQKFGQGRGL